MIALGLLVLAVAEAADRPRVVDAGETIRIVELSRRDAFWRFRGELVGQVCVVAEPGLVRSKGKWYAGELTCADGQPYYFFQVEIERGDFPAPSAAVAFGPDLDLDEFAQLGTIGGTATEEPGGVVGSLAAPSGSAAPLGFGSRGEPAPEWPVGTPVRIRAVSTADATYARKPSVVGLECTVHDAPMARSGEGWFSGALRCGGEDWFFFQVALDPRDGPTAAGPALTGAGSAPAEPAPRPSRKADGRLANAPVPAGSLVRIVDVGPADLHHADKPSLIGKTCTVVEGPLVPTADGLYAGRLFCGEAGQRQMYQVAVAPD